jgi:hypothetical protein
MSGSDYLRTRPDNAETPGQQRMTCKESRNGTNGQMVWPDQYVRLSLMSGNRPPLSISRTAKKCCWTT